MLDLEDINVKIDGNDKAIILLCSYQHLVDTFIYRRQTLTMVDVKETLSLKVATKKKIKRGESLIVKGKS